MRQVALPQLLLIDVVVDVNGFHSHIAPSSWMNSRGMPARLR